MHSRRAFGRRIEGPEAVRLGGRPDQAYRLALQVSGMGSSNAPDIAQLAHETLLQRAGCLREGTILRYRDPLPDSKLFEGVYLDDHVVVAVVPRKNALSVEGPYRGRAFGHRFVSPAVSRPRFCVGRGSCAFGHHSY